jgi:enoyl-CoA hydratase/carnithine racemase
MITEAALPAPVTYEVRNGIAVVTLNRPERLNAWTPEMETQYFDSLHRAAVEPAVRAIVVTGAGRAFCAGADMAYLDVVANRGALSSTEQRKQTFPITIPKPIIAAINGPCAGIGLVQALMCDVRYAAAGAKLTTAFARRGLIAEHGISWLLPRLVGIGAALDLLLSARTILAEEALQIGLVQRVFGGEVLLEEALDYARELADRCSPASMATIKRQVYGHLDVDLDTALEESNRLMLHSVTTSDFREGIDSFVEKRQPRFQALSGEGAEILSP